MKEFTDPVPDFLNEDERRQLIEFCEKGRTPYVRQRDRLLFTLILNTGLRRIEVSHLKWSDIDLDKRVLVVRDGKGGRHRVIAINDTLYEMLRDFPRKSDHVITTYDGKPITRRGLSDVAEKYVNRLNHHYQGRKRFSLHSLRATFATSLCEKGVSIRVVQSLLFHGHHPTTLDPDPVNDHRAVPAPEEVIPLLAPPFVVILERELVLARHVVPHPVVRRVPAPVDHG